YDGIMAYLDQIIEFGTFSYKSITCDTFINGAVCTYFYIIINYDPAPGLQFIKALRPCFVVKRICPQNCTSMNNNIITNNCIIINTYVGMDQAIVSNVHIISYKNIGLDNGIFSNFGGFRYWS